MLEETVSVWPALVPEPALSSREGALICISINVEPRQLESLLEALACVDFPVNPQIYHSADIIYVYPGGREEIEPTTLVEFPAYAGRLEEVRAALKDYGFDPSNIQVINMLEEIHTDRRLEPAPEGAPYLGRYRVKRRGETA